MKPFLFLLLIAGGAAAQYTYTPLHAPNGFLFFNLDGSMNNKGQVLGEAGNGGATVRFPVLWTGGVPQALPIPTGYSYLAVLSTYHVNDAGTVIGTVQDSSAKEHIAVWNNGVPSVLADAPLPGAPPACSGAGCICQSSGSSTSIGLNSAGHILGGTSYLSVTPGGPACSALWVYNGSSYRILPYVGFAQCKAGTTGATAAAINDADQVLENFQNFTCTATGVPALSAAIVQPNGSYSFIPVSTGISINNLGQVLGCASCGTPTELEYWDGTQVHTLGVNSGYGSLNNLGQVAYLSNGLNGPVQVWANGSSTQVTPAVTAATAGFNDAGQIAIQTFGGAAYLLTPGGSCAQDLTGQVQVTRGGLRLDRATMHFAQTITVTNTSANTIAGPISIALDGVPQAASLFGIAGATLCDTPQGSPFLNTPASSLAPGAASSVTLEFIDTSNSGITYSTRVLAGPGGR
jgi:hypothetical protein